MQLISIMNYHRQTWNTIFDWIDGSSILYKLVLSIGFAILTGVMAQIRIYMPFTPVPITGQVFAVLLSASVLGGYYGSLSQILYVALGIMCIPWFNGGGGGLAFIMGITGGYLIGFIPAVFVIGFLTRKFMSLRNFHFQILLMMIGVIIIHTFGAIHIAVLLKIGVIETMKLAVMPFIAVDLIKAVLVSGISASILPKK